MDKKKKKIAIFHNLTDNNSDLDAQDVKAEVSIVTRAIENIGYDYATFHYANVHDFVKNISRYKPSIVFNLIEDIMNDPHSMIFPVSLLEHLRVPFTGSGSKAMLLTTYKDLAKSLMTSKNIPTPDWCLLGENKRDNFDYAGKWIIKPVYEDASIGLNSLSVFESEGYEHLQEKMRAANIDGSEYFCERYIEGREFNISIIQRGNEIEVLPVSEIVFMDYPDDKPKIVDYKAKWVDGSFEFKNTNRSFHFREGESCLLQELSELSRKCWKLFGLSGYARVDIRVDSRGRPLILEINANPCISEDGGFIAAIEQSGIGNVNAIKMIIESAIHSLVPRS